MEENVQRTYTEEEFEAAWAEKGKTVGAFLEYLGTLDPARICPDFELTVFDEDWLHNANNSKLSAYLEMVQRIEATLKTVIELNKVVSVDLIERELPELSLM